MIAINVDTHMLNDDVFTVENIPSGKCVSCVPFTELLTRVHVWLAAYTIV